MDNALTAADIRYFLSQRNPIRPRFKLPKLLAAISREIQLAVSACCDSQLCLASISVCHMLPRRSRVFENFISPTLLSLYKIRLQTTEHVA